MRSRKEIQALVITGLDKSFDTSTSLTLYLRACDRLILEFQSAQAEGDSEQAYFVALRLVELVVNYIPRHPDAKLPKHLVAIRRLKKTVAETLPILDVLKASVDADYEHYIQRRRNETDLQQRKANALRAKRKEQELATESMKREEVHRAEQRPASLSLPEIRRRLETLQVNNGQSVRATTLDRPREDYHYPQLDTVNSKTSINQSRTPNDSSPQVPTKTPISLAKEEPIKESLETTSVTPSDYQFATCSSLENGETLKTVFVPASLRATFLRLASGNTSRNLETCGILSGILRNNAYFITTLILPAQASTSDTCHTTDEESLFNYQDSHDLFTLGWIHTHPTQTCFLSSVDLHTHCSYQLMLPEAIAIVCAPSKTPDWGCFRLTDPPGITTIKQCHQSSLFHPHTTATTTSEEQLYVQALQATGGHVRELPGMTFDIEDQRAGNR